MFKESVLKKSVAVTVLSVSVLVMAANDGGCVKPSSSWTLQKCMQNYNNVKFQKPSADYKNCKAEYSKCATYQGEPWFCDRCYNPNTCYYNLEYYIPSNKVNVPNDSYAERCQALIFNEAMTNCKEIQKKDRWGRTSTSYNCDKSQYTLDYLNKALKKWCEIGQYTCYD